MMIRCDVKTAFDRSVPLETHIARRFDTALRGYARYIDRVEVRLSDMNGPRVGPRDKVAIVAIDLRPKGRVIAKAAASDLYASTTLAAERARSAVARRVTRLIGRGRRLKRQAEGAK